MSENLTPKPGELWETNVSIASELRADRMWCYPNGNPCGVQNRQPVALIGYTAEYVEKLREEREGDWSKLSRERLAAEVARDNNAARASMLAESVWIARGERDEAIARAEAAEVALADAEAPTLDDLAEREPWRVLRAAARVYLSFGAEADAKFAEQTADRLEGEHAETAKRDRLIETARAAFTSTSGITSTATDGEPSARSRLSDLGGRWRPDRLCEPSRRSRTWRRRGVHSRRTWPRCPPGR